MAKIIEHGKYWVPEAKKAYKNVKVKCPECDNTILISYYYLEMDPEPCAWCVTRKEVPIYHLFHGCVMPQFQNFLLHRMKCDWNPSN